MAVERTLESARFSAPPVYPPDPLPPLLKGGTLNLLGGNSYVGKKALIAFLIRQFLEGTVLGYPAPAGQVSEHLFLSTSKSWYHDTQRWFEGLPVRAYSLTDDLAFNPDTLERKADRADLLTTCLQKLQPKPHALLWVDGLVPLLGGNLLHPDACYAAAQRLRRTLYRHRLTLIGTAPGHKRKENPVERYASLLDRVASTAALFAHFDTCFYLASPAEMERKVHTLAVYPHAIKPFIVDFRQDPQTGTFAYAPLDADYETVLQAIAWEPEDTPAKDLVASLTPVMLSRATVFRQLKELVDQGQIRLVRRGIYQRRRPS